MVSTDELFMRMALKQAQTAFADDEVPVGAVVVKDGQVVAQAHNQVERLKDPTAHAEMIAITQASNALSRKWLQGCTMYVTLEPCSMCAGALVLSRISKVVFGACDSKTGACGSVFSLHQANELNHKFEVVSGTLGGECGELLSSFFEAKRRSQQARLN